jgi:D-alanyl-D-alanine carboxypeptidase (penicillin-binding protein 5/6)
MLARAFVLCLAVLLQPIGAAWASAPAGRVPASPPAAGSFQPFETRAAQALLVDAETGTVLFEKAADQKVPPASLAKLMTMAVVFDALKGGRLRLDETFTVSENAWRKGGAPAGGTTMFARLGSSLKVRDLIRGAIIQSANDACLVLAEGMTGSEANFVRLMNAEATRLGLSGSSFTNATGLPDPGQLTTARDLARLARHLIDAFPEYYPIYKEPAFNWNAINQNNKNPLIAMNIGADGLAAGGTEQTGFGVVGSATRDGQRLIMVLIGVASDRDRADEARKLLEWGFRSFEKVRLFGPADVVADAVVFGGDRATVGLVSKDGLDALLPRGAREAVKGRVVYKGPLTAPVMKGQRVGDLELSLASQVIRQAPVYAVEDVAVGSLPQRALDGLRELVFGWLP